MPPWYAILGGVLFAVGAWIVAANFYLAVLRYPLHRLRGGDRASFQYASVVPVVGQIVLLFACELLHAYAGMVKAVVILMLADAGGLHVVLGALAWLGIASLLRGGSAGA
jgi:hypothetical protein